MDKAHLSTTTIISKWWSFSDLKNSVVALPSSVFEFERPGCRFSAQQRLAAVFYKGLLYGSVGFGCGIIGQGIANMIMNAKRKMHTSDENLPPLPPLVKRHVHWDMFCNNSMVGLELAYAKAATHRLECGVWTGVRLGYIRRALSLVSGLLYLKPTVWN